MPVTRWVLCAGTAAFLAALSTIQLVNVRHSRDSRIWSRLSGALLLAALGGAGGSISAHYLTIGVAVVLVAAILADAFLSNRNLRQAG